jgi:hypothetical protein
MSGAGHLAVNRASPTCGSLHHVPSLVVAGADRDRSRATYEAKSMREGEMRTTMMTVILL